MDGEVVEKTITKAELAEELKISERTLDRWATLRTGPPRIKIGQRVRYRLEAVERWLREREADPWS